MAWKFSYQLALTYLTYLTYPYLPLPTLTYQPGLQCNPCDDRPSLLVTTGGGRFFEQPVASLYKRCCAVKLPAFVLDIHNLEQRHGWEHQVALVGPNWDQVQVRACVARG